MRINLALTQSAQFYVPRSDTPLDTSISDLLASATSNRSDDSAYIIDEFRSQRETERLTYTVSIKAYITKRPVNFIEGNEYQDSIHALVALFEINNHLVVIRKSCAPFQDTIDRYFSKVPYSSFSKSIDPSARFQKLSLRNLTISDKAIRNKSFEAFDLNGVLSTHTAPWSIPYYLKVKDQNSTKSITTSSSRITEYSPRKKLDGIAIWANEQVSQFNSSTTSHEFLSSYAIPVELKDVLAITSPSAILIEAARLEQLLGDEEREIYLGTKNKLIRKLKKNGVRLLFSALEHVYEIENDMIQGVSSTKISRNKSSLTFNSYPFHKFLVNHEESHITLQRYIIENSLYSICFKDPAYMYYLGNCFKENAKSSGIKPILDILSPKKELLEATSEKGEIKPQSRSFSARSLFGIVEKLFKHEDYIFCDDLGIEWADHIVLSKNDPSISFIHSKHKANVSSSASNLHDVTGQAIKNLGNMFFSTEEFVNRKMPKFISPYTGSLLMRCRRGRKSKLPDFIDSLLARPQLHRKCILVCSFLSKNDVEENLKLLKSNPAQTKGHVVQLYWILSSFIHASKEMNVIPEIICKP